MNWRMATGLLACLTGRTGGRASSIQSGRVRYAKVVTERGPHRIGTVYRRAIYREYADGTFTTLKPRAAGSEYLGIMGPILRREVGDTIRVVLQKPRYASVLGAPARHLL